MSLISRLCDPAEGEEKLQIHAFTAAMAEYVRGEITGQQFVDAFDLTGQEIQHATRIKDLVVSGASSRDEVNDILILGESRRNDNGQPYYSLSRVQQRLLQEEQQSMGR